MKTFPRNFIILAALTTFGQAIKCYSRNQNYTDYRNGAIVDCTGYSYCYSYTRSGTIYAGCSITDKGICSSTEGCILCTTDYCNSMTPSSISCFYRDTSNNAGVVSCPTGISTCYSYIYYSMLIRLAGCGGCTGEQHCQVCSRSNCNREPPSIRCYSQPSAPISPYPGPGTSELCSFGITSCSAYSTATITAARCGPCGTGTFYTRSCVTCDSSNCNTLIPSSISCYFRNSYYYPSGSRDNGTLAPCSTGISNCYHQILENSGYSYVSYSGCGICDHPGATNSNCKVCSTNGCNYHDYNSFLLPTTTSATTPKTTTTTTTRDINSFAKVLCYTSNGETKRSYTEKILCSNSCYEYSFASGRTIRVIAGCGTCFSGSTYYQTCSSCSVDLCNNKLIPSSASGLEERKIGLIACLCAVLTTVMKLFR